MKTIFLISWALSLVAFGGGLKVSSLNPILTDMIKKVGGDRVQVGEVMEAGMDPHTFAPNRQALKEMQESAVVFAMGKGLETYVDGVKGSMGAHQVLVEVGRTIPSQKIDADPIYACCPTHTRGAIDPHWWHSVKNAERAVKIISSSLEKADPTNKEYYKENSGKLRKDYRELHNWVKEQVAIIDKKDRVLVTSHVAFAYFCKEYGFDAAYVQGLSRESEISARLLSETVKELRDKGVKAVFPEVLANPKMLQQIAKETNAKVGIPLYADVCTSSYEHLIRHNVKAIVNALK